MNKQQYINDIKNKIVELESQATLTTVQINRIIEAKEYISKHNIN